MRQLFVRLQLAPRLPYLLLAGISSALIYSAILLRIPLLTLYTNRILNLNHLPPQEWPSALLLVGCVVLLFSGYALGALDLAARRRRFTPLLVVGFPLIFTALLLLADPMTSTDVYDYLFRGRMLAHYGANTFVTIPQSFKSDPLFPYVAWQQAVTAYGPLWEMMSWLTARLAGEAPGTPITAAPGVLLRLIVAYKALDTLGFLLCGAAIWLALGRFAPERRWLGVYLWLWNPLALWESIAVAHNDVWMMLLIVLALWAFAGRGDTETGRQGDRETRRPGDTETGRHGDGETRLQPTLLTRSPAHPLTRSPVHPRTRAPARIVAWSIGALLLLAAGGLIKFVAFFFGPVLLVAALRRLPSWRERWRLLLIGGLVCLLFVVVAYAPFWQGEQTLRNVSDRGALFTATWLAALRRWLPQFVSNESARTIAALGGLALLAAGLCWAIWRAWRTPQAVASHLLWLVLWFLLICNPWFQPWYVIWALALVALQPWDRRAVVAVNVFCMTALISYVVGGLALPAMGLSETDAERELLLSIFLYVPPLIVLGWGRSLHPVVLWRSLRWPVGKPAVRL